MIVIMIESINNDINKYNNNNNNNLYPIFIHNDDDSNRMTDEQRKGIVIMHQEGRSIDYICEKVGCSKPTVYHWINHYKSTNNFDDDLTTLEFPESVFLCFCFFPLFSLSKIDSVFKVVPSIFNKPKRMMS